LIQHPAQNNLNTVMLAYTSIQSINAPLQAALLLLDSRMRGKDVVVI
jgi:hypothetical protein